MFSNVELVPGNLPFQQPLWMILLEVVPGLSLEKQGSRVCQSMDPKLCYLTNLPLC